MEETKILRKSAIITLCVLGLILGIIYSINMRNVYSYGTQSGTLLDIKRGSRGTDYLLLQPFEDTFTFYFGTQSVTGSGTTGYIAGSSTAFPRLTYNANTLKFNFVGAGLQNEGLDVGLSGSLTSYILITGGTGTTNVFTNTTLAGQGTLTATLNANGVDITPTELSYLDGTDSNIETHFTTVEGNIIAHAHTGVGTDSVQISHDSVTGTGTNSHNTIDSFIASKAQASGLASLNSNSLVVENPASGTTTPTASSIPVSDGSGKLSDSWLNSTVTLLGQTIEFGTETTGNTDNIDEGDTNLYYLDSRVNSAVGSLSVNALSDVNIAFNENDFVKIVGGQLVAGSSSATLAWSDITGSATGSSEVTTTPGVGLVYSSDGTLSDWKGTNTFSSISLIGTTTDLAASANGQWYVKMENVASADAANPTSNLYLSCDTGTLTDGSGYGHTISQFGGVVGSSTSIKTGFAGSVRFDGSDDYITIPDNDAWTLNADYTLGLFVKLSTYTGSESNNTTLVSHATDVNNFWRLNISNSTGYPVFTFYQGGGSIIDLSTTVALGLNTLRHIEVNKSGNDYFLFMDGSLIGSATTATAMNNFTGVLTIGKNSYSTYGKPTGYIDDLVIIKGTALHSSNFTPPPSPNRYHSGVVVLPHIQYTAIYKDPVNGNPYIIVQTTGTATDIPSYTMFPGSTTIVGAGTTTAVTGTSTAYKLWVDGAARVTELVVASTEEIKRNVKNINIIPPVLEATDNAKKKYIKDKMLAWTNANEMNYTYVGSDTSTYVDTYAMMADYGTHIELEWASDLDQPIFIKEVQDYGEAKFWQLYKGISPKSWNPIENLNITRGGFIVQEVPDEIKGDDMLTISPMKIIAFVTKVQQSLLKDNISLMKSFRDLAKTGTCSVEWIDDRLKVLEGQQ